MGFDDSFIGLPSPSVKVTSVINEKSLVISIALACTKVILKT